MAAWRAPRRKPTDAGQSVVPLGRGPAELRYWILVPWLVWIRFQKAGNNLISLGGVELTIAKRVLGASGSS